MINRFANTDDPLRHQQLAQWRATWAEPAQNDTADKTSLSSLGTPGVAAASALVASAMPLAFVAASTLSGGGAYAISPAGAMNAYREDRD